MSARLDAGSHEHGNQHCPATPLPRWPAVFLGHYGVAFALKRAEPKLSLGMLFVAVQFADPPLGSLSAPRMGARPDHPRLHSRGAL
jgi:hypothetical protein